MFKFAVIILFLALCCGDVMDAAAAGSVESASGGVPARDVEASIDRLLASMSLEQKVGQMMQGEIKFTTPDDVRRYGLGSILNGGGSFPSGGRNASVADWVALADAYYDASVDTSQGSAGVPIIWGTDAVHGHSNVIGATLFPHNIGLGAANDAKLMERIGRVTASEVAATGIDWIFAPTVAVAKDDRWGRTYESYSDRPEIVAAYAGPMVTGLQSYNMIATAKHFLGDGGTYRGIDQGDTRLGLSELLDQHGRGYQSAIAAGVLTVMASFNRWNGAKLHGSRELLTGVLKESMGFSGLVVSDWNGIGQVDGCNNETCPQAINAGIDMLMVPEDWRALLDNTVRQVRTGEISMARIDDAVRRILRVKFRAGVMTAGRPSQRPYVGDAKQLGSTEHRAVAREAVRKSLVLLKNNGGLLPLQPGSKVLVTGLADNIGVQGGGWTISWQGTGNNNADFPGATSIYNGIRAVVEQAGGSVRFSAKGEFNARPDVAIVVFGETPYAEGQGDIETLAFSPGNRRHLELMKSLRKQGVKVVAVFITGRPMWINAELNAADALLVAWLPGSEGGGVADLLFRGSDGSIRFDFQGRLSFDWPAHDVNATNRDLPVAEHLFPYGYGLSYQDKATVTADLNEVPIAGGSRLDQVIFSGSNKVPWQTYVGDDSDWGKPYRSGVVTTPYKELTVSAVDEFVQEDARELLWTGNGRRVSQFYWQSEESVDMSALRRADASLTMLMRVDQAPQGKVALRMDCGWPCSGGLEIAELLRRAPAEKWTRLSIALQCFEQAGANLAKVNTPFLIATDSPLSVTIREVSIRTEVSPETRLDCAELQQD